VEHQVQQRGLSEVVEVVHEAQYHWKLSWAKEVGGDEKGRKMRKVSRWKY